MNNTWLARFANEPALVAPHQRERFESCLAAIATEATMLGEAMAATRGSDEFWTELGERGTRVLRPYVVKDGLLLLPVKGVLLHAFPFQLFDYATGYEYIWKAFERGLGDKDVKGIALVVDSPGGMVAGNFDLVDRMFAARGTKPVRAFAAESAYSAAYSIASVADRLVVSRTGGVGSIGVVTTHLDISKAYDEIGFKVTFIYAGAHKVDGNPFEPLPDAVKARIQERIDALYAVFVDTVARNRNLDAAAVRATEAQTFTATEAKANGLSDAIGALDDALAEFSADITNPRTGDETMTTVTVASVKADNPDVAAALIAEGKELGKAEAKAETAKAVSEAVAADRTRMAALDGLLMKVAGNADGEKIVAAAKADGSSAEATALKLADAGAFTKAAVLGALAKDDKGAGGASPAAAGADQAQVPQTKEGWTAEWNASADLKAAYPKVEHYTAFKAAEARGGVKILERTAAK